MLYVLRTNSRDFKWLGFQYNFHQLNGCVTGESVYQPLHSTILEVGYLNQLIKVKSKFVW